MTQRRDSVFIDRVENEPIAGVSNEFEDQSEEHEDRSHRFALILLMLKELTNDIK